MSRRKNLYVINAISFQKIKFHLAKMYLLKNLDENESFVIVIHGR